MIEADLERRLQSWLEADGDSLGVPDTLRRRIADIPAQPTAGGWLHFGSWTALPAAAAVGVAGLLVATMLFGLFDAPIGTDGGTCNNRQTQQAIDHLRDAAGYRFTSSDQVREYDPAVPISISNPQYVWQEGVVSEGAYLAPDRVHEKVTFHTATVDRGHDEQVQIGGQTFQLRSVDGKPTWFKVKNWPTANMVYGYLSIPFDFIPAVTTMSFGANLVPAELPGKGGCTTAAQLPGDAQQRILALRVEIGSNRPVATYLGPSDQAPAAKGQTSTTFEISWTTPSADEFRAPETFVDESVDSGNQQPPPQPTAPRPSFGPSAWAPVLLPNPAPAGGSANLAAAAVGDGRFVAVGGSVTGMVNPTPDQYRGIVWTSSDGESWKPVDGPDGFIGLNFSTVAWDGSTFVAVGYRENPQAADGTRPEARPESWTSTDGVSWQAGGTFPLHANVGTLLPGGPGWVVSGVIFSGGKDPVPQTTRPVIFTSTDGATWSTVDLPDSGSGHIGDLTALTGGGFLAIGCELPGTANATGEACLTRLWRSNDGLTWTHGPILDVELGDIVTTTGGFLASGHDPAAGGPGSGAVSLYASTDGETWSRVPDFPIGSSSGPGRIRVVGESLVIDGQLSDTAMVDGQLVPTGTYPIAVAWRSTDGGKTWESISLALPEGAVGSSVEAVIERSTGLAFLGSAVASEEGPAMPVMWVEH